MGWGEKTGPTGSTGHITVASAGTGYNNYISNTISKDVLPDSTVFKYVCTIGDGASHEFVITHDLGKREVIVQPFSAKNLDPVPPWQYTVSVKDENTVVLTFRGTPRTNSIRIVVIA